MCGGIKRNQIKFNLPANRQRSIAAINCGNNKQQTTYSDDLQSAIAKLSAHISLAIHVTLLLQTHAYTHTHIQTHTQRV